MVIDELLEAPREIFLFFSCFFLLTSWFRDRLYWFIKFWSPHQKISHTKKDLDESRSLIKPTIKTRRYFRFKIKKKPDTSTGGTPGTGFRELEYFPQIVLPQVSGWSFRHSCHLLRSCTFPGQLLSAARYPQNIRILLPKQHGNLPNKFRPNPELVHLLGTCGFSAAFYGQLLRNLIRQGSFGFLRICPS